MPPFVAATIDGRGIYDPPQGGRSTNWFEMRNGEKPGVGKVLVTKFDADAIIGKASVVFEITVNSGGGILTESEGFDNKVSFSVIAVGYVPYSTDGPASSDGVTDILDMVELTIYDLRYGEYLNSTKTKAYNVQKSIFANQMYVSSKNGAVDWTWATCIADVTTVTVKGTLPTAYNPSNLIFDGDTIGEAMIRIAKMLGWELYYDVFTDTLKLGDVAQTETSNNKLHTFALSNNMRKRKIEWNEKRRPTTYKYLFRKSVFSDRDPYKDVNRFHGISKTNPTGDGTTREIQVGYWFARVGDVGIVVNTAELQAVADQLFGQNDADEDFFEDEYYLPGLVPFTLDGKVRCVKWMFDAGGPRTLVRLYSNKTFTNQSDEEYDKLRFYSNSVVNRTIDDNSIILAPVISQFIGKIQDASLQAGQQARWLYTIQEMEINESGTLTAVPSGRTPVDVINLLEMDHSIEPTSGVPWYVWGVDVHGTDYPPGFSPKPVGGGGTSSTLVYSPTCLVQERMGEDDLPFYTISEMGSHDGTCTTGVPLLAETDTTTALKARSWMGF